MRHEILEQFERATEAQAELAVSIVMPCLNEAQCLPHCIANAREALDRIERELGFAGEIVIADNGSTDGSQLIAAELGARVVPVAARGYGAALIGGAEAAFGRYILVGDADGSYDFNDGVAMIARLHAGADLCMGSRFKGGIAPGAMPWKNRHIGNPVLTGILNLLFRSGISDAHCGLRAIRKESFAELRLNGTGMEFASEMVIKAALRKLRIEEVPAKLLADLRDRPPHLRPWRDGWRHLRYLFMLSPVGLFAIPALFGSLISIAIFGGAISEAFAPGSFPAIGNYWVVLAGALLALSHLSAILALAGELYGIREGYRLPRLAAGRLRRAISLESMLAAGGMVFLAGLAILLAVLWKWGTRDFAPSYSVLPAVLGTSCLTIGLQNALGGFLLAILGGNEAKFLAATDTTNAPITSKAGLSCAL